MQASPPASASTTTSPLAVITGASSGFGADFARALAARGYALALVARREDRLRALAEELRRDFAIEASIIVADLSEAAERERMAAAVLALDGRLEILINNAGLGLYGAFEAIPWEKERQMLDVDIHAVVHLSKLLLPRLRENGKGYILNVSSIGAFQPTPLYASYSAAKAFVLSFSQALNFELRGSGVSATVVAPGVSATEFLAVSKQKATLYQRLVMMKSADVVRIALKAMFARRASVVPGAINALTALSTRFMPASAQTRVAHLLMKSNAPEH